VKDELRFHLEAKTDDLKTVTSRVLSERCWKNGADRATIDVLERSPTNELRQAC